MPTREIQDTLGLVLSPGCEEYRSLEENLRQIAWLGLEEWKVVGRELRAGKSRPSLPELGGRGLKMVQEMLGSTHAGYGCAAFTESNL